MMNNLMVAFVTFLVVLVFVTSSSNGQLITKQQEMMLDQLIIQQKNLVKELQDEISKVNATSITPTPNQTPISQAIFDSIFNVS